MLVALSAVLLGSVFVFHLHENKRLKELTKTEIEQAQLRHVHGQGDDLPHRRLDPRTFPSL